MRFVIGDKIKFNTSHAQAFGILLRVHNIDTQKLYTVLEVRDRSGFYAVNLGSEAGGWWPFDFISLCGIRCRRENAPGTLP